jgi:hypothetical protein
MIKKVPMCWKCASKITELHEDNSLNLVGCKEEPKIEDYSDAEKMCPLMKPKVLIIINGGVAQLEFKPDDVEVEIRDYDVEDIDAENDERCKKDIEGDWYQEMLWGINEEV